MPGLPDSEDRIPTRPLLAHQTDLHRTLLIGPTHTLTWVETPTEKTKMAPKGKQASTPEQRKQNALKRLQHSLDRANAFIADGTGSYARKAVTAARQGVERETVNAGIAAMREAITDLESVVDQAYKAPQKRGQVARRVQLS